MATASAGRAARGCREAPARSARPCTATASRFAGQGRGEANHRAKQPAPALKSEEADMNSPTPKSKNRGPQPNLSLDTETCGAASILPQPRQNSPDDKTRTNHAACKAIATIPEPSRQPEQRPSETPLQYQTPAREALRAVSTRTCVPIADILGRNRRPPIAAARHEAVWRVRLATGWSLPRLGRFFKRDHTTVLHSIREMSKRSARDPELRAYMTALSLPQIAAAPTPSTSSDFLFAPSSLSLEKRRREGWLPLAPAAPTRVCREAPARSARPCSATASRSAGRAGAKRSPRPDQRRSDHERPGNRRTARQGALRRRARAHAAALEARPEGEHQAQPEVSPRKGRDPDRQPRRKGWWDPTSDAKGDVFGLVQRLEPGINFGHVRKRLREFAGLSPSFPIAERAGRRKAFGQIRRRTLGGAEARVAGVRRPGAILPGSASFHRGSSRWLPWPASCGKAQPAAPGSPISTARVPSPTSTFAGRPTKARSPAAPSPSSACRHRDWLKPSRGSFSPRPRSTL